MPVERPLDLLNSLKGKQVVVERKSAGSTVIEGKLVAFDIHINLVIEGNDGIKFIRGDVIETISPKD